MVFWRNFSRKQNQYFLLKCNFETKVFLLFGIYAEGFHTIILTKRLFIFYEETPTSAKYISEISSSYLNDYDGSHERHASYGKVTQAYSYCVRNSKHITY